MHIRYVIGYVYHICLRDTIQSTQSLCLSCQAMLLAMPPQPLLPTLRSGSRGALHHQFPLRCNSRPRTSTRFPWGMSGGRFPSVAALRAAASCHPLKVPPASPPPAQPFGCLQAGFLWIAVADSAALLSTTFHYSPALTGWGTHLAPGCTWFSSNPRLQARGTVSTFPCVRSRVTQRVLRPLTWELQGQPSPLRTPHGRSRVQENFPDFPWSGCPWLAGGSFLHGDLFCTPTVLFLGAFCRPIHPAQIRSQPRDAPFPFTTSPHRPSPSIPFHDPSCVFTPHRAASNPLARARRTVSCPMHRVILLTPVCSCLSPLTVGSPCPPSTGTPPRPATFRVSRHVYGLLLLSLFLFGFLRHHNMFLPLPSNNVTTRYSARRCGCFFFR